MAKRLQQNSVWIALLVLAALGGYMLLDLKKPIREPNESPKVADIVSLQPDQVTRIELNNSQPAKTGSASQPGDSSPAGHVVLAKSGKDWTLQEPIKAPADPDEVKRITDLLDRGTDLNMKARSASLAQYGLDKPALQITFAGATGAPHTLQIGAKEPSGSNVYARDTTSGRILLLPSIDIDPLKTKDAGDLRDKTVVNVPAKDVASLSIRGPDVDVEVTRSSDGKWAITRPWSAPADDSAVQSVLDALAPLKADHYLEGVSRENALRKLSNPRLLISIVSKDGSKESVAIKRGDRGMQKAAAIRVGSGEPVELSDAAASSFGKTASDLRDKKLMKFETDQAEVLTVVAAGGGFELKKAGADWQFVRPLAGQKADKFNVEGVLGDIAAAATKHVAENPPSLAPYGLDKPAVTATVTLKGGAKKELQLGKRSGANYYARGTDAPTAVFEVGSFVYSSLKKKPEALK